MGTEWDPMGTQRLKKVPMGTRGPKWGPTWEQCIHLLPSELLKMGLNSIKFSFSESWRPKSGLFPDHFGTLNRIWTKSWIPHLCVSTGLELKKWQQSYQKGLTELCCCSLKFGIIDHRSISFTTWQRPPQQGWYSDFGSNKEKKKRLLARKKDSRQGF